MSNLTFRKANLTDINIYFKWINEHEVREKSFNSSLVKWEDHVKWFNDKLNDPNYSFYIFQHYNDYIGQVRIHKVDEINSFIGVSICINHRGLGYGSKILQEACSDYFKSSKTTIINAYIKFGNISSKKIFEKAGFNWLRNILYNNFNTDHYVLYADRKL